MFAHVHATGKGYFAHAGAWVPLANETATLALSGGAMTGAITTNSTFDGRDVATDGTKLDGIEASATADQTNAEIRTAVEAATDSNVFTDADHTKLDGIETAATADQTKADIEGLGIDVPAANLTGTIAAARLSTAATQVESDDSTKIATTAYVTDKITTLIGGAPSTLNDLNELAAAINDDANYNTTLTTALGTKMPIAGGTFTGAIDVTGTVTSNTTTSTGFQANADTGYSLFNGATNSSGARINIGGGTAAAGITINGYNAAQNGYTPLSYLASTHTFKIGSTPALTINSSGVISGDGSGLTGVGASTAFGAVGTYYIGGWLLPSYTHIAGGSTVAGSGIYDEGVSSSVDRRPLKDYYSNRTLAGLSGTWRIMSGPISNYPQDVNGTLFVRIA
jgi:hypothetical protein